MSTAAADHLRYPIGTFRRPERLDRAQRATAIDAIGRLPDDLRGVVANLTAPQLDTPYRPDGWTVRQLAHHIPDSHLNAYIRLKLALTEDEPTIKPYDEARWAELADSRTTPIGTSLALLEALHARWTVLLRAMDEHDFARTLRHPESGLLRVDQLLALYAWHGAHHVAHITRLRERMGW